MGNSNRSTISDGGSSCSDSHQKAASASAASLSAPGNSVLSQLLNSTQQQEQVLLGGDNNDNNNKVLKNVQVSSRTGVPLHKTVQALLGREDDYAANEKGLEYIRKVLALLFLQYAAVLMILSPFCLIQSFQRLIEPIYIAIPLGAVSFFGLIFSIYLVATKGHIIWYARASLFSITVFVAVGLGLKLAHVWWASYALIAVAQSSANFGFLLAVTQFDSRHLQWLEFRTAALLCFAVSLLWILIMREIGSSWLIATTVPVCGWLYAINILFNIRKSTCHREPHDYLRATIFILGPQIPGRLIPKRPTASGRWAQLRAAHRLKLFTWKPTTTTTTGTEASTAAQTEDREKEEIDEKVIIKPDKINYGVV